MADLAANIEQQDEAGAPQAPQPSDPSRVELDPLAGENGGAESRRLASFWRGRIDEWHESRRDWMRRGRKIERRYRDERGLIGEEGQKRTSSLWANVQILYPALYGRVPVPVAERRFKDADPAGRNAASMLERALRNEIEINGFDEALGQAVMDYLLPGQGTVWLRYEPEIAPSISLPVEGEVDMRDAQGDIEDEDESEPEQKLRETGERIVRESVPVDYIQWNDLIPLPSKARIWKEVSTVGKRVYLTRDACIRRFGPTIGRAIPLQKEDQDRRRTNESIKPSDQQEERAIVYELWCRDDLRVYWIAEGYEYLCDRKDDPYKLTGFFPVPRPIFANATNNTLVPVPDYMQYQDQAVQIDRLTQRISMLVEACKVAGVYNAAAKDVMRLLDEGVENELIPVDDWAAFGDGNGVAGNISFLPLKEIIGVIQELTEVEEKTIVKMDRLTGITDVLRGTTDARETLGGQRLKTNAGATRLQHRQGAVARLARDIVRMMAEIMCNHFSDQSLLEASGVLLEEGIGMPDVLEAISPSQPPMPAMPAGGGLPMPPAPSPNPTQPVVQPGPAMSPPAGPGAPMMPPGAPPPVAPAGNVIPFPGPGMGHNGGPPGPMPGEPDPATIAKVAAIQRILAAIELLRNDRLRGFRVDIEVDSTVMGDQAQDKADRTEFLTAVTKYLQTAQALGMAQPDLIPLLGQLLKFGVRGFKVARELEAAIDDFVDQAEKVAKQRANTPPPPSPEQIKAQSAEKVATIKAQSDQSKAQNDAAKSAAEMQAEQAQTAAQAQSDREQAAAEVQRQALENQGEMANAELASQRDAQKMEWEREKIAFEREKMDFEREKMEHQLKVSKLALQKTKKKAAGGS